jgi:hypothetical protein
MSVASIQAVLGARDPETLIGPLFYLFTSLALHGPQRVPASALAEHLMALALHPDVDTTLRLAAGALAIEHRR